MIRSFIAFALLSLSFVGTTSALAQSWSPPARAFASRDPYYRAPNYGAGVPAGSNYYGGGYNNGYGGGYGVAPNMSRTAPGSVTTVNTGCGTIFQPTDHNPRQLANGAMLVYDSNGVKGPKFWHVVPGTENTAAAGKPTAVTNNCGATGYVTGSGEQ